MAHGSELISRFPNRITRLEGIVAAVASGGDGPAGQTAEAASTIQKLKKQLVEMQAAEESLCAQVGMRGQRHVG